ncbi:MAG: enoyl-CoA hydratase/isomerase family protein [Ectothiorhodospiraceae bacterium]|nr:enoyl-CoA hydratase/isomerase family protein [Ectothiorhodospiraceae bacterium]MCH8503973.1 enoyl-CoA hydratase/isomerase family protein [Ectothiorhodospiraceae bacterium]
MSEMFPVRVPEADDAPCVTQDFGAVRLLFMNNQRRRNALSMELREHMQRAMAEAIDDPAVRAIVLTGAGGYFSAGGDITSMTELNAVAGRPRMQRVHNLVRQLYNGPKPVVAAVEGGAVGAGLSLAAACDIIVGASDARFGAPFNRIGAMPDLGLLFTLPGRIGMGRTRLLAMTGRILDAATAEQWGLLDVPVEAGTAVQTALEIAGQIADGPPLAHTMTKQLLGRLPLSCDEFLAAEADAQALLFSTEDFAEGRDAFLQRRQPRFTGR